MPFEIAGPSCPLCKRESAANSAGQTLDTRLCKSCQTMVLTAFRGADSLAESPVALVQQKEAVAQVQHDAPALDYELFGSPAFFEDAATVGPGFEQEPEHQMPFEAAEGSRFDFFEDEDPETKFHTTEPDLFVGAEPGSSQDGKDLSDGFVQSMAEARPEPEHDDAEADNSHLADQSFTDSALDPAFTGASLGEVRSEEPPSMGERPVTDPWEAPLPAWDYSHSEWPVLVGSNKQDSRVRRRVSIAAIALLACAAGFYFLVYRVSTPGRRVATDSATTERVSAVADPQASAATPEDSYGRNRAPSTPPDTSESAASKPADAVAREAVAANDNNAQGRFSLQAAAFPNRSGADEFAERLKRAGVPSYVAPVDLARRGRWFRVRVGRFTAAEEAQKFAGETQQRARAAGLSLQLIVCQYDQP